MRRFPNILKSAPMTKLTFTVFACSFLLSACVGAPQVDLTNVDSTCAQQCSANHTKCMSGFKMFPLANEQSCKTGMETCIKTCLTKSDALTTKPNPGSVADRLKALEALRKDGLIRDDEYESKRQEILKTM